MSLAKIKKRNALWARLCARLGTRGSQVAQDRMYLVALLTEVQLGADRTDAKLRALKKTLAEVRAQLRTVLNGRRPARCRGKS